MTRTWRRTLTAIAVLLALFALAVFALGLSVGLEARGTSTVVLAPGAGPRAAAEIY
jgi:hypothetical protein